MMRLKARLLLMLMVMLTGITVQSQSDKPDPLQDFYNITHLEFSPDETQIAIGGGATLCGDDAPEKYEIRIVDAEDHTLLHQLQGPTCGQIVHWNHDGTRLATSGMGGNLYIWDAIAGGDPLAVVGVITTGVSPEWNADDTLIATADGSIYINFRDPVTALPIFPLNASSTTWSVSWHPTNPTIIASGHGDGFVRIWDIQDDPENATMLQEFQVSSGNIIVKWHPSLERILISDTRQKLLVLDTETGHIHFHYNWPDESLIDFNWSDDGQIIVAAGTNGQVRAWDMDTDYLLLRVKEEDLYVWTTDVRHIKDTVYEVIYGGIKADGTGDQIRVAQIDTTLRYDRP